MDAQQFLAEFGHIANAPGGVAQLRELILQLAVQGKLFPQDPADIPASELLKEIAAEKQQLVNKGKLKAPKSLPPVKLEEMSYPLPRGWEWVRLGNIAEIERGGSPRPIDAFLTDDLDGLNWIKIGDTEKGSKFITSTKEKMYLFVPNRRKLNELGAMVGTPDRFFRYAEGAYIGDLLEEVRITIKKREENAGNVSFTQLSEGELQMLTVLGLMRITHEDHCLFLLDEPDTHLNPIWKLRYFDDINRMIEPREGATLQGESQIIVTTHDPIMVGSLKREQVRILRKIGDKSEVDTPTEHPQGMGVAGLLKSDMFGLSSTLDHQTLRDLELRNELIAKDALGGLDAGETAQLERLRHHLDELGFSREYRDPMYQLFIQKMYEVRSQPLGKLLTPEQLKEQEELATRIVKELISRERTDDLSELAKELKLRLGS